MKDRIRVADLKGRRGGLILNMDALRKWDNLRGKKNGDRGNYRVSHIFCTTILYKL